MTYTIIEDASPYYIRFTHEGIDTVINKSLYHLGNHKKSDNFVNHRFTIPQSVDILTSVPMVKELKLMYNRVSMFITPPGVYYRAHKDGLDHRYSLNYTVKILDDQCITSWYSDEDLENYELVFPNMTSRECSGFDKTRHTPLKQMVAVQGECILVNTDIFHDFDNSTSLNERLVLTFRNVNPSDTYFEDARKQLFGIPAIASNTNLNKYKKEFTMAHGV
jgi:hypothetical protein